MSINYGDLENSPFMIARAEREADARLDAGYCEKCQREAELLECQCDDFDWRDHQREMQELDN